MTVSPNDESQAAAAYSKAVGRRRIRILAVASGGGHWEQLMWIRPAFGDAEVVYGTTMAGLAEKSGISSGRLISDFNRHQPVRALLSAIRMLGLILAVRPTLVVSTGAAPGLLALAIAKTLGARTMWIDSVANAEELSLSGRQARHFADVWLTQWEHLAHSDGPQYWGGVL